MTTPQLYHNSDGSITIRFPYDRIFVETIKTEIPAWSREYDPGVKAWKIGYAYRERIAHLLRQRFGYVEEFGTPVMPETPTGCSCDPAHRRLHVCQDAPDEVIRAAYRALSKSFHPDRGGDHHQMVQLTEAYEELIGGAR